MKFRRECSAAADTPCTRLPAPLSAPAHSESSGYLPYFKQAPRSPCCIMRFRYPGSQQFCLLTLVFLRRNALKRSSLTPCRHTDKNIKTSAASLSAADVSFLIHRLLEADFLYLFFSCLSFFFLVCCDDCLGYRHHGAPDSARHLLRRSGSELLSQRMRVETMPSARNVTRNSVSSSLSKDCRQAPRAPGESACGNSP